MSGPSRTLRRLSDKDDLNSTASFLFPHLVKKKADPKPDVQTEEATTFSITDLVSTL
jgi:hypothetical protein